MLLDRTGKAIAVSPQRPELIGTPLADQYDYLRAAVDGRWAVSNVVASAVEPKPIIAVAVPFDSAGGRRVISGGYALAGTSIDNLLAITSTLKGREIYLVDATETVIATTQEMQIGEPLSTNAPELTGLPAGSQTIDYRTTDYRVVVTPIDTTRWKLIAAVPRATLIHPATRSTLSSQLVLAGAALMVLMVIVLQRRLYRERDRLRVLNTTDLLTGIANRARGQALLQEIAETSEREQRPWSVAVVDIDHFKSVNDEYGHPAGDRALQHVARILADQTRASDTVVRWGGEEFVVVMPDAGLSEALAAAERLRHAVRAGLTADQLHLTVSIGVASGTAVSAPDLVAEADRALYRAKAAGRDRTEVQREPWHAY